MITKPFAHGRRQVGLCSPWIFIHNTDKVDGGLMVLFFGLAFRLPPPLEIFLPTPLLPPPLILTVLF